jgi:hypothetical protein
MRRGNEEDIQEKQETELTGEGRDEERQEGRGC